MENRFKLRLSRFFQSSFSSCSSRNLSDITEKAIFVRRNPREFQPIAPKPRLFPSICRPGSSGTTETISSSPRRKVSERDSPAANIEGRTCPPASPVSPLNTSYRIGQSALERKFKNSEIKNLRKKKKKIQMRKINKKATNCSFNSSPVVKSFGGAWWYSSGNEDEQTEDETETLFSSKSRSSDSSDSRRQHRSRSKKQEVHRRRAASESTQMGKLRLEGKVKDSFAVVKKSNDPYSDFRTSMVEMIVEKQIFGAKDLEQLLQCFLSLNSKQHHEMIVEVFTEIWEALFSDWGS